MKPIDLANLIAKAIIKDGGLTLEEIETRCQAKGFDLDLVYEAMEYVRRKPRITSSGKKFVLKPNPKPFTGGLTIDYPPLIPGVNDCSHPIFDGIDLSWMFLKTKEERDQYHADAKNMPVHMIKSKYRKS